MNGSQNHFYLLQVFPTAASFFNIFLNKCIIYFLLVKKQKQNWNSEEKVKNISFC